MVEGGAQIVPEEEILEALFAGHDAIQPLLRIQEDFRRRSAKPKRARAVGGVETMRGQADRRFGRGQAQAGAGNPGKARTLQTYRRSEKRNGAGQALAEFPDKQKDIKGAFEELKKNVFSGLVIHQGAAHRRARSERHSADYLRSRSSCRALTARRYLPAARLKPWSSRLSVRLPMSSVSTL